MLPPQLLWVEHPDTTSNFPNNVHFVSLRTDHASSRFMVCLGKTKGQSTNR